jgi:TPR repeat protein
MKKNTGNSLLKLVLKLKNSVDRIVKCLIAFSLMGLLTACGHFAVDTTPPNDAEVNASSGTTEAGKPFATLAEGKASFLAKNYKVAYQQLLPLAQQGNADAQYAVGYMLYYGKGVDRNEAKARDWMNKAAAQGQPAAKKAIIMF